ncbi:MAG: phage major tail protein, TP901-1 family [Hyphomicrobiales bacterium]|nr:phage major tail protein, TP901-1 family [Hyphomicrobiales bacterium]MDE2018599.1 phage major tail protein, TP901-1 family [Hyphomicrobiales bacterium]
MAAQRGKDLLLKIDDGTGTGTFVTVAGLRARRFALAAANVDVTDADAVGRWRVLLAGAGELKASISGTGVFKDQQSDQLIQQAFFDATIANWQIVVPDLAQITGPFQISGLDYRGDHATELTFEIALESAGPLALVVVA